MNTDSKPLEKFNLLNQAWDGRLEDNRVPAFLIWHLPISWYFLRTVFFTFVFTPVVHVFGIKVCGSWYIAQLLIGFPLMCLALFLRSHWFRERFLFMLLYWTIWFCLI